MPLLDLHAAMIDGALDPTATTPAALISRDDGAVASFLGVVRAHHGGRGVTGLRYDSYRPMAELQLQRIATAVAAALDDGALAGAEALTAQPLRLVIVHAVGELRPGDVSLAVHASSPHRVAAFAACREVVEAIKRDLPVWKLERYDDGEERYLKGS